MAKSKVKYMHTMDDKPATYHRGQQIAFVTGNGLVRLADSLEQIRKEQAVSLRWRERRTFRTDFEYGYRRVAVS